MKQLVSKIATKRNVISLSLLAITSLLIWLFGPMLVIENQYPLQTEEKRIYIMALMVFAWIFQFLFFAPAKDKKINIPKTPEAKAKLQALQGRFQGALRFLKKTEINKNNKSVSLAHLPWCLIIGPHDCGKTSLLANSNINYILTKQFKQEKIAPSDTADWWVTRDSVLVDVPGLYLTAKNNYLWQSFINLIKVNSAQHTLNTVVIALQLPELLKHENSQQKKQIAADLKQKILQLREKFGNQLNFYLIITKCDLLPGFAEFFNEYTAEETTQAWGITLPLPKENEKLLDIFGQRFNALIKRLNSQLIYRLHHERNPSVRPAIKDFPLQVERLKDFTGNFLKILAIPDLRLHGVYLTSALQSNVDEKLAQAQVINSHTHQSLQLLRNPIMPSKPYFIRQLLLQGIFSMAEPLLVPKAKNKNRWLLRGAYSASVAAIITSAIFLGRDFQQSVLLTYSIQNDLAQYQLAIQQHDHQGDHLVKALPLLNALQSTATHTNNNLSKAANLLSFYSDKSQKTATTVYQQALQTIVLPEIKNSFETYLKNSNDKNPAETYAVLKAYLMLSDAKNLKINYIANTFKKAFSNSLSTQASNDLTNHIQAAFNQASQPIELNNQLISQVRSQLTNLSSIDLAFVILKNMNDNNGYSPTNLSNNLGNPPVFNSKIITNQIPNLFTESVFSAAISEGLPQAATEALQGNDVLGNAEILSNEATINNLVEQLRDRYIQNYAETWESLLTNLKLTVPTNLAQTDAIIANLMSNTSPLLHLLNTIKSNTAFPPVMNSSPKLQALNNLLANAHNEQANTLYQVFVNLRQLHFYLQNILTAADPDKAAFETAKKRMLDPSSDPITQLRHLAEQNPEPIKGWLNSLAMQSWNFILQGASHHIENAWKLNIQTIYNAQIHNPSSPDFDVQQFASFVGKQGTFANFYQQYLKFFIMDDGKHWQWKVVDNQRIPFGSNVLEQLQQAAKLQKLSKYALFTQAHQNPDMRNFRLPDNLV